MSESSYFSPTYSFARDRFRRFAAATGGALEAHRIHATSSYADELTIDVACWPGECHARTLVLSSGIHGVEGFFGSAVQLALLQGWESGALPRPKCRVVMLHALNPYGFAERRRFNEDNIDLNRNFLLPSEKYAGAPEKYAELDRLLNPPQPPALVDLFPLHALAAIVRIGVPTLMQTIAAGQYEFPRGLFFGGKGPSQTYRILQQQMPRWLAGSERVIHLDFHTGLGPTTTHKLLIDYPLSTAQRDELTTLFGAGTFVSHQERETLYVATGGFGQWCVQMGFAPRYTFATAEFGTYPPAKIVAGLRRENQAHHYGRPDAATTLRAKARLQELFCPGAQAWRRYVVDESLRLIAQAVQGLS